MDVTEAKRPQRRFRSALLAVVASLAGSGVWAAAPRITFNIPAGEFSQSVLEFYAQSRIEIFYASVGSVTGVRTQAVVGEFEVTEALSRMLAGTGFTFEFENAHSVLVKRAAVSGASIGKPGTDSVVHLQSVTDQAAEDAERMKQAADLQEVVVTGSYIHGVRDIISPLVIVGAREKKQAPYATVQDVLRALPFNLGGGPSEDFSFNTNFNRGSGINLHGLGAGATLVLVNGQRQPVSGIEGDFVDVSTIPLSAVDRIEVLPDGSSALYGSDAIAGVVNIILRKELSGGETNARLGTALGGGNEVSVSQLIGNHWNGGEWLFAYQYSERTALAAADRAYAANADKRSLGGTDQRSTSSNPGNILDPLTLQPISAIPGGQDGTHLTPQDLLLGAVNRYNQVKWRDLLPDRSAHSVFFTVSQKIGDRFEFFGEGRYNQRSIAATERPYEQLLVVPASNPFFVDASGLPFVLVAYDFSNEFGPIKDVGQTETYTATLGVKANLSDRWHATLSGFHGTESMHWAGYNLVDFVALDERLADPDPATAFNPFGSGSNTNPATLDELRRVQRTRAASNVNTMSLVADGPLPDLFGRSLRVAIGVDSRRESLSRDYNYAEYQRRIAAAFAELSVGVTSRLDFSLAGRYENYSDFGDTYNPKIGLRWSPTSSLRLRGSWGSSFRAPSLVDLYDRSQDAAALVPLADAQTVDGHSTVLVRTGSNPDLREETASTWTVGIDFAPASLPGLTLSSTYYSINYRDRTWHYLPSLTLESMLADSQWASLATRSPPSSQIDAICHSPEFVGLPSDCRTTPPGVVLDVRAHNLSATTVSGIDLELRQALRTKFGNLHFELNAGYLTAFEQALTQAAAPIELVNIQGNPPRLRVRSVTEWYRHNRDQPGFGASVAMDYLDGFRDFENSPVTRIPSWVTLDIQLNYRTPLVEHWMGNVEMTLNAVNVLNLDPPFVNRVEGYDPVNAKPFGRVVSFEIQKKW